MLAPPPIHTLKYMNVPTQDTFFFSGDKFMKIAKDDSSLTKKDEMHLLSLLTSIEVYCFLTVTMHIYWRNVEKWNGTRRVGGKWERCYS